MITLQLYIVTFLKQMLKQEEGQDLVEYSLVIGLLAFGSIVGMHHIATSLSQVFSSTASVLNTNL